MVTASVLLIHNSSPWTGQAARGSTRTRIHISLIQLFISLIPIIEITLVSTVLCSPTSLSAVCQKWCYEWLVSAATVDKTPGLLLILLFIIVFNEKLLHTLHTVNAHSRNKREMCLGGDAGRVSSQSGMREKKKKNALINTDAMVETLLYKLHALLLSRAMFNSSCTRPAKTSNHHGNRGREEKLAPVHAAAPCDCAFAVSRLDLCWNCLCMNNHFKVNSPPWMCCACI